MISFQFFLGFSAANCQCRWIYKYANVVSFQNAALFLHSLFSFLSFSLSLAFHVTSSTILPVHAVPMHMAASSVFLSGRRWAAGQTVFWTLHHVLHTSFVWLYGSQVTSWTRAAERSHLCHHRGAWGLWFLRRLLQPGLMGHHTHHHRGGEPVRPLMATCGTARN